MLLGLSGIAVLHSLVWGVAWSSLLIWALTVALVCAVVAAWFNWGRTVLTLRELLSVPAFVWRKLGVYGGFLWQRERHWRRTDRD